ncbi:MAG TPA: hypothetical protein VN867_16190, partial [Candidatus Binataceae bacterium]|nr:hypothetical protein [Candidatus Binataceae bacterium]
NTLGTQEMHDMPASSVRELYDPSFSVSVPPAADLNTQYNNGFAAPAPGSVPEGDRATPFNTEEIPGPSSSLGTPAGPPAVNGPGAPAQAAPPAVAYDPAANPASVGAPAVAYREPSVASADPTAPPITAAGSSASDPRSYPAPGGSY